MALQFDKKRILSDFIQAIDLALNKVAETACEYMRFEIDKLPDSGSHESVGASEWRKDVIDAIKFIGKNEGLRIIKEVGLINADELTLQRGLLVNYGMGRTSSKTNPYLEEYISSEYYDSNRGGFSVYTRPGESVYDYETGGWKTSSAKSRYEIESFWQEPSYFFETALRFIYSDLESTIEKVFDEFNFGSYLAWKGR